MPPPFAAPQLRNLVVRSNKKPIKINDNVAADVVAPAAAAVVATVAVIYDVQDG